MEPELPAVEPRKRRGKRSKRPQREVAALVQAEVDELRAFMRPPLGVLWVVRAALIILSNAAGEADPEEISWEQCQAALKRRSFVQRVRQLDPAGLGTHVVDAVKPLTQRASFTPENVAKVSSGAGKLASWVLSMCQAAEQQREYLQQSRSASQTLVYALENDSPEAQLAAELRAELQVAADSREEQMQTMLSHPVMNVVVAVDGSDTAHAAFAAALQLRRPQDFVSALHLYRGEKPYLPPDLHPQFVRERYEQELQEQMDPFRFASLAHQVPDASDTAGALAAYVNAHAIDLVVLGMVGRKGPKLDPCRRGSSAEFVLRASTVPLMICKPFAALPEAEGGAARFVVGVSGSETSHAAFRLATALMQPGDALLVLHVVPAGLDQETLPPRKRALAVRKLYSDANAAVGRTRFACVQQREDEDVGDCILDLANRFAAQFIALGGPLSSGEADEWPVGQAVLGCVPAPGASAADAGEFAERASVIVVPPSSLSM